MTYFEQILNILLFQFVEMSSNGNDSMVRQLFISVRPHGKDEFEVYENFANNVDM